MAIKIFDYPMCNDNEKIKESIELFRKAVKWYETDMDVNEAADLYEKSALLGNRSASHNYYFIIDAMSYKTEHNDPTTRHGKIRHHFRPENFFLTHDPSFLTELTLQRIYLNNGDMFHRIFMENKEIHVKYEKHIEKSKIYSFVKQDRGYLH